MRKMKNETTLRPISDFGRFILDELYWSIVIVFPIAITIMTHKLILAIIGGILSAMFSRLLICLFLRLVLKINPSVVEVRDPLLMLE